MKTAAWILVLLAAAASEGRDLAHDILREVKAKPVDCPQAQGVAVVCGDYTGDFSKFRFELDFELGLQDYRAEPLSAWKLVGGMYRRSYRIEGQRVTVGFDRKSGRIEVVVQPYEEAAPESEGAKPEGEAPSGEAGGAG